jgi:hypothetical protein
LLVEFCAWLCVRPRAKPFRNGVTRPDFMVGRVRLGIACYPEGAEGVMRVVTKLEGPIRPTTANYSDCN